jgi:hypothetical protein
VPILSINRWLWYFYWVIKYILNIK